MKKDAKGQTSILTSDADHGTPQTSAPQRRGCGRQHHAAEMLSEILLPAM
jgi:hypothetical protein